MEVGGTVFYEKKEAGAALLAVCQSMKQADAMINVGQYQGFSIRLKFDSWNKEFILSLKMKTYIVSALVPMRTEISSGSITHWRQSRKTGRSRAKA